MSTSYHFSFVIGFPFDIRSFAKRTEAEYRSEPRYDPKTGKRVADAEIMIKGATEAYIVDGKEVDSYDFVEAINRRLRYGKIRSQSSFTNAYEEQHFAALNRSCDKYDLGNINLEVDTITLPQIPNIMHVFNLFKKELEDLLKVKITCEPVITLNARWG